jgi:DNA polymerase III gamma/tau subunit
MDSLLRSFEDAVIIRNVVARTKAAMEFPTEKARKDYLREHPDADPKNHTVKKQTGGSKAPAVDSKLADEEHDKSKSRTEASNETFKSMKSLTRKVDDGNKAATKKFNDSYDKLYEGGEEAAKVADKLLKEYSDLGKGLRGEAKSENEATIKMLRHSLNQWNNNKIDHMRSKSESGSSRMNQVENTYGYAQQLESFIRGVSNSIKGDYQVDESWRGM